ncbi:hypothetical protein AZOA_43980 [Azoarcus sp. Aa7]|nr:hypothetical protein [Azoarcus sp. Aa7]
MKSLKDLLSALLIVFLLALIFDARACEDRACLTSGPRLASMDSGRAELYGGVLSQFTGSGVSLGVGDWNSLAGGGGNEDFLQAYPLGTTYVTDGPQSYSGDALGLSSPVQAVTLSALLTEAPIQVCGPEGTTFRSAAMRVKMDFTLDALAPDTSALAALPGISTAEASLTRLALYAETGRGSGSLTSVSTAAGTATVQATPGVAALYLGSIPDGVFTDRNRALDPATDLDFAPIGRLHISDALTGSVTEMAIEARSHASGQGATQTLTYTAPYPQTRTASSGAGFIAGLATDLTNNLELRTNPSLGAMDSQVRELLLPAVRDALAPLLQTLAAQAIDPAFHLLGLGLGEMDVTVERLVASCTVAGSVFADADHDGRKSGGEAGTGQVCYVKLLPADQSEGPALQVTAANTASGSYRFEDVPPGSYTLVVNRDSDAASVAPAPPAGWVATTPRPPQRALTLAADDAAGLDFGLFHGSRLAGTVFRDNGVGSGSANNGRQDGGEAGIAGVAMQATDAAGTVYDRADTDSNGAYTLWLPASAAGTVRVTERNGPATVSVGGSAGNTGGSYDREQDTVSFGPAAGASYAGVDFADVPANTFSSDHRQAARAGAVVFFPHVFVAGSAGRFALDVGGSASPAGDWSSLTYLDADCNGALDGSETVLAGPVDLLAEQQLCLVVKTFVPANAPPNAQYAQTLRASFSYANAGFATVLSRGDLTLVGEAGLRLAKRVDKTAAGPGETVTYVLSYENLGTAPLHDLKIHDATPAHTIFAAARCEATPAGLACELAQAPPVAAAGALEWRITGPLAAGTAGSVSYSVTVQTQ